MLKQLTLLIFVTALSLSCAKEKTIKNENPEKNTMNRLANSQSPYLLQHKNNPVDWYPWGDEAFEKAVQESKPIFL